MEVKPGYKQTEVGVIPKGWKETPLGHIATVAAGGTPSRNIPSYWNGDIPWVTTTEIDFGTITETEQHISLHGLKNSAAKLLRPGTLLMALYGQGKTRGKVALLGIEATSNQACAAIVLSSEVSKPFVFHFLASRYDVIRGLSNSGSQENLNGVIVKSILIPLPPTKAEQEAIAGALSDADALIESLEQLVAKKRQIKHGAMQQLLTGQKRLPGFTGEWETKRLGELGTFLKGSGVSKSQAMSGHLPCVRYGELYTRHNDYIKQFYSFISPEVALTATPLKRGDILFAGSGETKAEIGKCAGFVHETVAYAGGDIVILRTDRHDPLFLGYFLNTPEIARQKASRGQGDAVVHISGTALAELKGKFPKPDEQAAIAVVLSEMDAELAGLEAKVAKARQVKQGMMQELLTGRIRLV
jgi:type I restriction enzyme S subunit